MKPTDIVVLTGGTGTVKLIKGLYKLVPEKMFIVANTGDDFDYYGLLVSPDTDSVIYSLSKKLDEEKMWGLQGDTFKIKDVLQEIDGAERPVASWFNLGDKDLGYCLYRTKLLNEGKTLTEVTKLVSEKLGLKTTIVPMTNDRVTTYFLTKDGKRYHFEEFFIRLKSAEPIENIEFVNAESAKAPEEILQTIQGANLIIIGPSNPITSIGPILAIKDIRDAMKESTAKKIVISPIVGTEAYSGPAKIYMEAQGIEVSPKGILEYYKDLADEYYFDEQDKDKFGEELTKRANELGKKIYFEDIFFNTEEKQVAFAKKVLARNP